MDGTVGGDGSPGDGGETRFGPPPVREVRPDTSLDSDAGTGSSGDDTDLGTRIDFDISSESMIAQPVSTDDDTDAYKTRAGVSHSDLPISDPGTWALPRSSGVLPSIGGYEVIKEIGRGGMGVVYQARQVRLNRLCAIKMLLHNQAGAEVLAIRFLGEAESVARLFHPNIVQIYAVGEAQGFPFIELEYIPGGSLEKTLNGSPSTPRYAAETVETIARAIQAAHEAGIIHRDLKPANILLAADGSPKVSDFGLAKSMNADSGLTQDESVLGTPSYMAPEQAFGNIKGIGVGTDVYALGAILYEMLTGRPPFLGPTVHDTVHQVKFDEPVAPRTLQPGVPRDLETIALKCLNKEPSRRYESAEALADDLRRYLDQRPILARPVGVAERAWRLAKRRPVEASLAALLTLVTAMVVVGSSYAALRFREIASQASEAEHAALLAEGKARQEAHRATEAEAQAVQEAKRASDEAEAARGVARFLAGIFEDTDPIAQAGRSFGALPKQASELKARDILDRGRASLKGQFVDRPLVRATLLDALGRVYFGLGELEDAEPLLNEALAIRRTHLAGDDLALAESLHSLGMLHQFRQADDTGGLFEEALRIRKAKLGEGHALSAQTLFHLGLWTAQEGKVAEGAEMVERALELTRKASPDAEQIAYQLMVLIYIDIERGQLSAAVRHATEAIAILSRSPGSKNPAEILRRFLVIKGIQVSPLTRSARGQYESLLRDAKTIVGPSHLFVGIMDYHYAQYLFYMKGRTEEARRKDLERADEVFTDALRAIERNTGKRSWVYATVLLDRGRCRRDMGRVDEGEADVVEALQIQQGFGDKRRGRLSQIGHVLGAMRANKGDAEGAIRYLRLSLDASRRPDDFSVDRVAGAQALLSILLNNAGHPEEADRSFRDCIQTFSSLHPDEPYVPAFLKLAYADFTFNRTRDPGQSLPIAREALAGLDSLPDALKDKGLADLARTIREKIKAWDATPKGH